MNKRHDKENPVIEHIKLLKKHGRLDEKAFLEAVDVLDETGNQRLLEEYLQEQAPVKAEIAVSGKPFSVPDETADGIIRFATAYNDQPVGLNPHECHVLIAGQTGCGKSTLLRLIFTSALLLNERQE